MNSGNDNRLKLTPVFGRVVRHPDIKAGRPFLNYNFIEVFDVLEMMRDGLSDKDICGRHRNLRQADLDACRAYQARFLVDELENAFGLQDERNIMMLDENTSYLLLPDVVRMFGRSSHVYAEGLYFDRNDDEKDIWAHLVEHKYAAIITSDNDFKRIARRRMGENGPAVIYIGKNNSRNDTRDLLARHRDEIKAFIESKPVPYAMLSREGLKHSMPNQPGTGPDEPQPA